MEGDSRATLLISLLLLVASAFFVCAEYGMIGSRKTKIEALAKKGSRNAKALLDAFQNMSTYVAAIQNGITLCGIALGAVTEPALSKLIEPKLTFLPDTAIRFISIVAVAMPLVTLGELVPKYLSLRFPERIALATIGPLRVVTAIIYPLVWFTRKIGELILRPFGIHIDQIAEDAVSREELALMIQASQEEGQFEVSQATVINKALKFDQLDAADVMIHRLDIKWIDKDLSLSEVTAALKLIPHSRIPVCQGDIDEVVGLIYLQDILKAMDREPFNLQSVLRPAVFVPENITLDKVIQRMRETKTQILLVRDEYGGTAGMLTLEDVVEEVFGELEDSLEGERPQIERVNSSRVTARADVRYDELLEFLDLEPSDEGYTTETLAEIVVNELRHVPRLGDAVELSIGTLRVENMARSRMTRITFIQKPAPLTNANGSTQRS